MSEELSRMKAQVYKDPRPPEYFERYHKRGRRRDPDFVYELVRIVLTPVCLILFRARCIASENVPQSGAGEVGAHPRALDPAALVDEVGGAPPPPLAVALGVLGGGGGPVSRGLPPGHILAHS